MTKREATATAPAAGTKVDWEGEVATVLPGVFKSQGSWFYSIEVKDSVLYHGWTRATAIKIG